MAANFRCWLRRWALAVEDRKAYYLEAATAQPGASSPGNGRLIDRLSVESGY